MPGTGIAECLLAIPGPLVSPFRSFTTALLCTIPDRGMVSAAVSWGTIPLYSHARLLHSLVLLSQETQQ